MAEEYGGECLNPIKKNRLSCEDHPAPSEILMAAPHARHRILVVDDSVVTIKVQQKMLERALENHNLRDLIEIDRASDGKEACEKVHALSLRGESYALITMDLSMPILDGLHATEIVRQHM